MGGDGAEGAGAWWAWWRGLSGGWGCGDHGWWVVMGEALRELAMCAAAQRGAAQARRMAVA